MRNNSITHDDDFFCRGHASVERIEGNPIVEQGQSSERLAATADFHVPFKP
jgi:hypothetical protein